MDDDFTLRRKELSPPEGQTRLAEVRLTAIYPDGKRKTFTVWYGHPVQIDELSGGSTFAIAACWGPDQPPRYIMGEGAMQAIHMASLMINSWLKHMLNQGIRIRYPRSSTNLGYSDIDCFSTPRLHQRWHGPFYGHIRKAKSMKHKPAVPNPDTLQPLSGYPYLIFLRNAITNPRIHVGEYTYFDDPRSPGDFESRNVLYHYDFIGDHLHIGRFCCIARDVRFIMNGANHSMAGFSTYPFYIFGGAWADMVPPDENQTSRGDTVVGSDVWIGYGATILPGIKIGHGAIIGACSVVTRDVEPYTIVGGNPAQPIRKRYDDATIARLLELAWWDWPAAKLTPHLPAFIRGDRDWLASADADQNSAT